MYFWYLLICVKKPVYLKPIDVNEWNFIYFNQEKSMYNSYPLVSGNLNEFHPYVTYIENVMGVGNCGFPKIVFSRYHSQYY